MTDARVERYLDEAVRFVPDRTRLAGAAPLRVARSLLTCGLAAEVLNAMRVPEEDETSYRHINVHNPRCPLVFDRPAQRWACVAGLDEHPLWSVSWAGAALICGHLGARLPSVAEWECFASNNEPARRYPWGDAEPDPSRANYDEHHGGTTAVGRFAPSEIGLLDLAGNLSEWCTDRGVSPFERVVKGGAWSKPARFLAIAASRGKWERLGTTTIGLRPVWDDGRAA